MSYNAATAHTVLSTEELEAEMERAYLEARRVVFEEFELIPADVREFLLETAVDRDILTDDDEVLGVLEAWSAAEMDHCEACNRELSAGMLAPVMTMRATHVSPAEYVNVCVSCVVNAAMGRECRS